MKIVGGLSAILTVLFMFVPGALTAFLGIGLGLVFVFLVFFIFGLVSPFFVDLLVNNPRARGGESRPPIKPGRIYFFTFLEDGQTKVVIKGSKFIRAIMADPERVFTRSGGDAKNSEYWGIRPAEPNEHEEPVSQFELTWNPLSWWIHWMYYNNGAVWVGIPFFRELRIDKNVRVVEKKENGRVVLDSAGLPVLEDVEDWSDHLRTKTFYWYFKVPSVDSQDNIKIGYTGFLKVRCVNPYLASFNVDHWDSALTKETSTWINNFNRAKLYDDLVSSPDQTRNEMADFLLVQLNRVLGPGGQSQKGIGMEIVEVNVIDQDPQLTEVQKKAQTAKWEAERNALATVITAEADKKKRIKASEGERQAIINVSEGNAQGILNELAAITTNEELGKMLAKYKMMGKLAETDKAMIFLGNEGGAGGVDLTAALLKKLEEIKQSLNNTGGVS
jgi:regulator of protease activity HflC (stomatin/prohibitin superfamily)